MSTLVTWFRIPPAMFFFKLGCNKVIMDYSNWALLKVNVKGKIIQFILFFDLIIHTRNKSTIIITIVIIQVIIDNYLQYWTVIYSMISQFFHLKYPSSCIMHLAFGGAFKDKNRLLRLINLIKMMCTSTFNIFHSFYWHTQSNSINLWMLSQCSI